MSPRTYTTGEAADQIGVSRQTLHFWIGSGKIRAPKPIEHGETAIRLWTKEDIDKVRKFKGTLRPGPKSKKKN
jgi:excisionase family DNA binding protein